MLERSFKTCTSQAVRTLAVLLAVILASGCNSTKQQSLAFPKQTYTLLYESRSFQREDAPIFSGLVSSDGKGHFCYAGPKGQSVRIIDYLDNRDYSLNNHQKTAGWMGLTAMNSPWLEDQSLFEVSPVTAEGRTVLKTKTIEGYSCTGYSASGTKYWFDEKTHVLVLAERTSSIDGKEFWIARLKKYSGEPMSPANFAVPAGYKVNYGMNL